MPAKKSKTKAKAAGAASQGAAPAKSTWGGRRPGAGRKPGPGPRRVEHRSRLAHDAEYPVHVSVRSNLRLQSEGAAKAIREAILSVREGRSTRFRVVHYAIQDKHFHAVVEASSTAALVSGVRSLVIRIARQVNRAVHRRGQVWADRWKGRQLDTPRAVRDTLVTLFSGRGKRAASDPYSSAGFFSGFLELRGKAAASDADPDSVPVSPARTELLTSGWKRLGLLASSERATPAKL